MRRTARTASAATAKLITTVEKFHIIGCIAGSFPLSSVRTARKNAGGPIRFAREERG